MHRPLFAIPLLLTALSICALGCTPPANDTTTATSGSTLAEEAASEPPAGDSGSSTADKGQAAVQVSIVDLAGLEAKIKEFAGKVVVVDIWSNSCAPCLHEFPNLVALSSEYPERVACISLNVDYIGLKSKGPEYYLPKVQAFLEKQQATFTNFLSAAPDEQVLTKFEAESIPAILIFDRQGNLAHKLTDANSGDDGLSYAGDVIPKLEALLK